MKQQQTTLIILSAIALLILFVNGCTTSALRIDASVKELKTAIEKDSNDVVAHYNLGLKYLSNKSYKKAIEKFQNCISLDNHFAPAYFGMYVAERGRNPYIFENIEKEPHNTKYIELMSTIESHLQNAVMYDPYLDFTPYASLIDPVVWNRYLQLYQRNQFYDFEEVLYLAVEGSKSGKDVTILIDADGYVSADIKDANNEDTNNEDTNNEDTNNEDANNEDEDKVNSKIKIDENFPQDSILVLQSKDIKNKKNIEHKRIIKRMNCFTYNDAEILLFNYIQRNYNYIIKIVSSKKRWCGIPLLAYDFMANSYYFTQKYDSTIISYNEALLNINENEYISIMEYNNSMIFYKMAFAYMRMDSLEKAKEYFQKTLMEDLSYYMAHYHLSYIHQKNNNFVEALNELEAAILLEPNDPNMYYNKGVFLEQRGLNNDALASYKKAIELNNKMHKAYYNLALVYEKTGEFNLALDSYKNFVAVAPSRFDDYIRRAKRKIDILSM